MENSYQFVDTWGFLSTDDYLVTEKLDTIQANTPVTTEWLENDTTIVCSKTLYLNKLYAGNMYFARYNKSEPPSTPTIIKCLYNQAFSGYAPFHLGDPTNNFNPIAPLSSAYNGFITLPITTATSIIGICNRLKINGDWTIKITPVPGGTTVSILDNTWEWLLYINGVQYGGNYTATQSVEVSLKKNDIIEFYVGVSLQLYTIGFSISFSQNDTFYDRYDVTNMLTNVTKMTNWKWCQSIEDTNVILSTSTTKSIVIFGDLYVTDLITCSSTTYTPSTILKYFTNWNNKDGIYNNSLYAPTIYVIGNIYFGDNNTSIYTGFSLTQTYGSSNIIDGAIKPRHLDDTALYKLDKLCITNRATFGYPSSVNAPFNGISVNGTSTFGTSDSSDKAKICVEGYIFNRTTTLQGWGLCPTNHMLIQMTPFVGKNINTIQNIFGIGATGYGVTLTPGRYLIEARYILTKTAGATSHVVQLAFDTLNGTMIERSYNTMIGEGTSSARTTLISSTSIVADTTGTPVNVSAATATANYHFRMNITGMFSVFETDTIIPRYKLTAAPGGAYTTQIGSYIKFIPICNGIDTETLDITTYGNWIPI